MDSDESISDGTGKDVRVQNEAQRRPYLLACRLHPRLHERVIISFRVCAFPRDHGGNTAKSRISEGMRANGADRDAAPDR
jgi:hypothetical protein